MKKVIEDCRRLFGEPPRTFDKKTWKSLRMSRPLWLWPRPFDRLNIIFREQKRLIEEGKVVWGCITQANSLLFKPGPMNHPAEVLYSFSGAIDEVPQLLKVWAHQIYALKGTKQLDPTLAEISHVLADEKIRTGRRAIPNEITGGVDVYWASVIVAREHLPNGYLSMSWFPVVICEEFESVMILPSMFWSQAMIDSWLGQRRRKADFGPTGGAA